MSDTTTLELLTAQVVLVDGVWVAYAEDGTVLDDPDGVLLTGNIGAILVAAAEYRDLSVYHGAGHWKHLFRAIQVAEAPSPRVKAGLRVRVQRPETYDLRQAAATPPVVCTVFARISTCSADVYTNSPYVRTRMGILGVAKRPKCAARTAFMGTTIRHSPGYGEISGGCATRQVRVRRSSHYTFYTPQTVQNPTEEMLLSLLVA